MQTESVRMKLDTHAHTVSSGHAYSTVKEYAEEAEERGLELIAITDHAPQMPGASGLFHFSNLRVLPRELFGVRLLAGAELNIMDTAGKTDLPASVIKRLDVVIASLHTPCFAPDTCENNTLAVINAMKNPLIHIIGHLGDPRYPIDISAVVAAAKETNTLIEMNNSSLDPRNTRSGGAETLLEILRECGRRGVYVSLGSDAHFHKDIGNFENLYPLLVQSNIDEELIVNSSTERFLSRLK